MHWRQPQQAQQCTPVLPLARSSSTSSSSPQQQPQPHSNQPIPSTQFAQSNDSIPQPPPTRLVQLKVFVHWRRLQNVLQQRLGRQCTGKFGGARSRQGAACTGAASEPASVSNPAATAVREGGASMLTPQASTHRPHTVNNGGGAVLYPWGLLLAPCTHTQKTDLHIDAARRHDGGGAALTARLARPAQHDAQLVGIVQHLAALGNKGSAGASIQACIQAFIQAVRGRAGGAVGCTRWQR